MHVYNNIFRIQFFIKDQWLLAPQILVSIEPRNVFFVYNLCQFWRVMSCLCVTFRCNLDNFQFQSSVLVYWTVSNMQLQFQIEDYFKLHKLWEKGGGNFTYRIAQGSWNVRYLVQYMLSCPHTHIFLTEMFHIIFLSNNGRWSKTTYTENSTRVCHVCNATAMLLITHLQYFWH